MTIFLNETATSGWGSRLGKAPQVPGVCPSTIHQGCDRDALPAMRLSFKSSTAVIVDHRPGYFHPPELFKLLVFCEGGLVLRVDGFVFEQLR